MISHTVADSRPRLPCSSRSRKSQYWLASGRSRPHCACRIATARGVAWIPSMVRAGSPGIRCTMKNTMIVTPTATGTSCSSRLATNDIRPNGPSPFSPALPGCLLTYPDILQVIVAERGDKEAVHVGAGGVGVRRVVQERHERVGGGLRLDVVVQRLPGRGRQGLLRAVGVGDDLGVVVRGEERARARLRVDGEGGELVRVGDVHGPVRQRHVVFEVLLVLEGRV